MSSCHSEGYSWVSTYCARQQTFTLDEEHLLPHYFVFPDLIEGILSGLIRTNTKESGIRDVSCIITCILHH